MSLIRWKPRNDLDLFHSCRSFEEEMDRFFGRTGLARESHEALAVDIFQDEKSYKITADVPGMNKEDIQVKIEDGLLTISGQKKLENEEKQDKYYLQERFFGSFTRSVRLPKNADMTKIDASYKNGVLEIKVAKSEESLPKMVDVKVS